MANAVLVYEKFLKDLWKMALKPVDIIIYFELQNINKECTAKLSNK